MQERIDVTDFVPNGREQLLLKEICLQLKEIKQVLERQNNKTVADRFNRLQEQVKSKRRRQR